MKEWMRISLLLCVFGFLRDNRPSEPFITPYLVYEYPANLTSSEINKYVYPVGTYSTAAQLIIVFLITDFLRYKPLIVVIGISGIIVWSLLLWTKSLVSLQVCQFFYGTYMASEVAYYTYIYAKVDKKYYAKVTSHTRAAMLIGKLFASISSQILVNFSLMSYKELNYITLSSQICATFWALLLPNVITSIYFHRNEKTVENPTNESTQQITYSESNTPRSSFRLLWSHFYGAYTNWNVLQWSLWYALGLCGQYQVISYIQILWSEIETTPYVAWNGAVDAVSTFLGAICALAAGYIHTGRLNPRSSLFVLGGLSILEGLAILLSTWSYNLYWSYVGLIVFNALYAFTITITSTEIARHLPEDSFGLVFGINTLVGTIFQSILTLTVISDGGFKLNIVGQYVVYSFYFVTVGVMYFFFVFIEYLISTYSRRSQSSLL